MRRRDHDRGIHQRRQLERQESKEHHHWEGIVLVVLVGDTNREEDLAEGMGRERPAAVLEDLAVDMDQEHPEEVLVGPAVGTGQDRPEEDTDPAACTAQIH